MDSNNTDNKVDTKILFEWLIRLTTIVVLPLLVWLVMLVLSLDKDVAIFKENRFTTNDAYILREMLSNEHNMIRSSIPSKERVAKLEDCVRNLQLGRNCD